VGVFGMMADNIEYSIGNFGNKTIDYEIGLPDKHIFLAIACEKYLIIADKTNRYFYRYQRKT
jgi:hypothetical protein